MNCCQKFVLEIECKVFVNLINLSREGEGGSNTKISNILLKNYPTLYTKIFTVKWKLRENSRYHLFIYLTNEGQVHSRITLKKGIFTFPFLFSPREGSS